MKRNQGMRDLMDNNQMRRRYSLYGDLKYKEQDEINNQETAESTPAFTLDLKQKTNSNKQGEQTNKKESIPSFRASLTDRKIFPETAKYQSSINLFHQQDNSFKRLSTQLKTQADQDAKNNNQRIQWLKKKQVPSVNTKIPQTNNQKKVNKQQESEQIIKVKLISLQQAYETQKKKNEQAQSKLKQAQSKLKQTQSKLKQTQSKLKQTQSKLKQTQSNLQNTKKQHQQQKNTQKTQLNKKYKQMQQNLNKKNKKLQHQNICQKSDIDELKHKIMNDEKQIKKYQNYQNKYLDEKRKKQEVQASYRDMRERVEILEYKCRQLQAQSQQYRKKKLQYQDKKR